MKNYLFSFILLIFSFTGCKTANVENAKAAIEASKDVHIVLLAGQSNMAGAGDYDELDNELKARIEKISNRVQLSFNGKPAQALSYFANKPSDKYKFTKRFGPELLIGLVLAEKNPTQNYLLIKRSQGGTALYGAWNPDWDAEKAKAVERGELKQNIKLYRLHIETIRAAIADLEAQNKTHKIIGLAWMQGENDAAKEVASRAYKANLLNLIKSYKRDVNTPNLPVVIGQINSSYGKFKEGPEMVRRVMKEVANADVRIKLIETSMERTWLDYPKHTDNVHYNAEGQKRLGMAFGEALLSINKN